jgi:hypothetical protein
VELPIGLPASSLNHIAGRYGADLIVLGSHGAALWREAVQGCFSCTVVHNAEYPTLLISVRVKQDRETEPPRLHCDSLLRHVLFPTDFSAIGVRAREFVELLASRGIGQVTLLSALDVPEHEAYPKGYQKKGRGPGLPISSGFNTLSETPMTTRAIAHRIADRSALKTGSTWHKILRSLHAVGSTSPLNQGSSFLIAATMFFDPDPHREIDLIAWEKGMSTRCTRSGLRM